MYICIHLINQTSDFHEIFRVKSENVTLCRYDLILNQWGHFVRFLNLFVHELLGQTSYVCRVSGIGFQRVGRVDYDQLVKYIRTWTC